MKIRFIERSTDKGHCKQKENLAKFEGTVHD